MKRSLVILLLSVVCLGIIQAKPRYNDCYDHWKAGARKPGVFEIHPNGTDFPTKVYCGHSDDATYTVIQRRLIGNENFFRTYAEYQRGFGNPQGDYWAGLDVISSLTNTGNNLLRIDMSDWNGNNRYAQYHPFTVLDRSHYYQMFASGFIGNVPDDMSYQSGNYFFTYDAVDQYNCARNMRGGWWYYYCAYAHLNGVYYRNGPYNPNSQGFYDGIYWKDWLGFGYSLKHVTMTLYRV